MSKKPVEKGVFVKTYQEFKKKILDNQKYYNTVFKESKEYKALYDNDERRTNLYNYMNNELKIHVEHTSTLLRSPASVWTVGTNEEIKQTIEDNPDISIIFNINKYLEQTRENRQSYAKRQKQRKIDAEEKTKEGAVAEVIAPSVAEAQSKEVNEENEEVKQNPKLVQYKKKEALTLKYYELSPEQKNNKIIEVTDRLRFELEEEGYSLDLINGYYSGTLDKKQKDKINKKITEIMKNLDLGMTAEQYKSAKTQAIKRSSTVADSLAGATGIERKNNQTAPQYIDAVSNETNILVEGISPSMTLEEQKAQLETNYRSRSEDIIRTGDDISMSRVIYDLMRNYGVADTIRDISAMILPAIALTASGYKDVLQKKLGRTVPNPLYISQNLIQRGYKNIAKFIGGEPSDDKKQEPEPEPDELDEPDNKQQPETDSKDIRITDNDDVIDFGEESRLPRFTAEEAAKYKKDVLNVGVGAGVIGVGVGALLDDKITTKPVASVIDNLDITREKINPRTKGSRTEGKQRQYSSNIIYPDDEILEPTENQLLRSEYNLAKFDFINPDNVGGNNSDGDNPLYKANDTELAIRYYDWKRIVIEKENEFIKQLPPKVSDKIKKQFRRSFIEPAEPIQTRLNYMIHDDTQFAPFNSPYSVMTENTGTNPFIQNSILFGSVP